MNIDIFIASQDLSVIDTLCRIDECGYGILYIIDEDKKLIGAVSDGDVRRWIIKTNDLTAEVKHFMNPNPKYVFENEKDKADELKRKYPINSLPVINSDKIIVDIILFEERRGTKCVASKKSDLDVPCVIMAGGKGTRLYPYTKILPKPLIPIGDTPILERIFERFADYGVRKFFLTVNYKKNMIRSYFDDVRPVYAIEYVEEDKPLGTGGSLKLINEQFSCPIIVANCDSLINADYSDLYDYHLKSGNDVTVVSALKNITVPYGVLRTKENGELISMEEKPRISYFINTGMYIVNPDIIDLIPGNQLYHMTDLVADAMKSGKRVGMYPISDESFLDMGEFSEMARMEQKLNTV